MDLTEQYQEQPSPGLNAIPLQYYSDTGQDPLSAFAQSNQHCNNLFNQLTSARHEHPACVDELADLNRRQQEAVNGMRQTQTAIQLQQSVTQLQNYLRALESKIATIRAQLLNQIETSGRLMSHAMQVLVNQKLVDWLVRQKACSCGTKSENQRLYDELGHLDIMFEEFGREILFLVNLIASFYQTLNATDDFEAIQSLQALRTDIVDHSKLFVWQSVIVAVQPPAVLVKCRGSDSHRSTRFPCHTEIRLLGGDALGVRGRCSLTRVELIGEDMARRIQADPAQIAVKDTSLHLTYNESRFEVDAKTSGGQLGACRAPFDRIRLVENTAQKRPASVMSSASGGEERKGTRRSKVASLRYYLAFQIELIGHHDIEVRGYKLSLPVAALVHSSIEADASLFWDRAFADGTGILSSVPERVPWEQAKAALNRKFLSLMQEVQEAKDTKASLLHPRSITSDNMEHLALRLDVSNNMLSKKNFFAKMVANKLDKDGKPTPCPFYEWFYRCAAMTNKYMQEQWNDGLVDGFCSKDRAEAQLQTSSAPTMLIRFSDVIFGHLKLSCRLADGKIVHYEAEADAMPAGTTIANAIRSNPTFSSISYVFPNEPLARIWEGKDSCREKKASETRSQVYSTWTSLPPDYFASTLILENKPVAAKH